jgi:hypothetical protein
VKVLVFIDHDIICRHFVTSGVLAPLVENAETTFVFPGDGGRRVTVDPATLPLGAPWLRMPIDLTRQQVWRWRLYADQLKLRHGGHEAALRAFRWRSIGWKAGLLLTLAGLPGLERIFMRWTAAKLAARPNRALADLLDRERPDVVIHPSVLEGFFINDVIDECARREIPSVVVMNSWDNPSTKRAVVGHPDWLIVWGPHTRDHAIRFIGVRPERTIAFGAAQFDVFREPPRQDRATLCRQYGFDPAHPVLLYAGANTQTDEFATMQALDLAITRGALPRFNVIYRPHPWGGAGASGERFLGHRFDNVRIDETMRDLLEQVARGNKAAITLPDYRDAHDLLSSVDMVVSPLSTIVVEATLHAKPVICFFPEKRDFGTQNINAVPLYHFEEFFALPDVVVARTNDSLYAALRDFAVPGEIAARGARLKKAAARFVATFDRPWGERFVSFIETAVKAGHARRRAGVRG